jgi:hypothetical protein
MTSAPVPRLPTPAEINLKNAQFWSVRAAVQDRQTADLAVCTIAFADWESEARRRVSSESRKSYEECLADAENSKILIRQSLATVGGKAAKPDALRQVIAEIVSRQPEIRTRQILFELRKLAAAGDAVISKVDRKSELRDGESEQIHFVTRGKMKTSPVSGLGDRLSRIKKR